MNNNLNVFEQLFGKQGEVKVESLESDKNFCTGVFQNGMFEKRITPIGQFVRQVNNVEIPYLTQKCQTSFVLSLPKVPIGMLHAIHKFYAHVLSVIKSEVAVQIFWDTEEKKYVFNVPKQIVAGASIKYTRNEGMWINKRYLCVVNSHSHCAFNAFFSGTDTADEVNACTFLVLGHVDKDTPSIAFRAGCNGSFADLNLSDVFDVLDDTPYEISIDNVANLTENKSVSLVGNASVPWYARHHSQKYTVNTKQNSLVSVSKAYAYDDDQDYMRFMSHGGASSYYEDLDYDNLIANWESDVLEYESIKPIHQLQINDKKSLQDFQTAFNLFAQSTLNNPDTSDIGMLIIADFVMLMDNLNYEPVETLKAIFDEYDRTMKQSELNEFFSYVCQSIG